MKQSNIKLLKETKFETSRKRGAFTIPEKISTIYDYPIIDSTSYSVSDNFISFYRIPYLKKLFLKGNPNLIYLKSKEELIKTKQLSNFLDYLFIKHKNIIVSNGFYYTKYFNMAYYPTYFYKLPLVKPNKNLKKYRYGIYIRDECNDMKVLNKFLKETSIDRKDVLMLGKDTYNNTNFFDSIDTYLVNNEQYDSVSNTLLEALYAKKKIKLMNNLTIANGNKELLEAFYYFKEDFFNKLDNLNNYCWKDIRDNEDLYKRKEFINKLFKESRTFIIFLNNF